MRGVRRDCARTLRGMAGRPGEDVLFQRPGGIAESIALFRRVPIPRVLREALCAVDGCAPEEERTRNSHRPQCRLARYPRLRPAPLALVTEVKLLPRGPSRSRKDRAPQKP